MSNARIVFRDLAERAAAHPRIEQAVVGAIRAELPGVIESLLRDMYPGEQLRLYVPQRDQAAAARERSARDERIRAAGASGMSTAQIAHTEGVTVRLVQMVLKRPS
jgi:hypothetical protein